MNTNNSQEDFLAPMYLSEDTKKKWNKKAKKSAKKSAKKDVKKAPASSRTSVKNLISLYGVEEATVTSLCRKTASSMAKSGKEFKTTDFLAKFKADSMAIANKWYEENKVWVYQRLLNNSNPCKDSDFIEFREKFRALR